LNNFGTLRKSQGTNTTLIDSGITLLNAGTIAALTGSIQFNTTPSFAAGDLEFGIGGTNNFGHISAAGTVGIGGGLSAVLLNGFVPSVGSQFVVLNYGGTNGSFTDFSGLNVGGGVAFTPAVSNTAVTLTVVATNFTAVGPTIITQPLSQTANFGSTVTLQVGVSGTSPLVYQWSMNNSVITNATNAILTLTNVQFTQSGTYTVAVSNSVRNVASQPAQLTVVPVLPVFTTEPPASITVPQGSNAVISVVVAGEPPPILQWVYNANNLVDGGRISGSATTTLTISNVQPFDAGNYSVTAANAFGMAVSSTTVLHVNFPDLAVAGVTPPSTAAIGQFVPVVFTMTNVASGFAEGTWLNEILYSTNASGTNAVVLGTASFTGTINPGGSVTVTQTVIIPSNLKGTIFLGVTLNSADTIAEITTTNNTAFASTPTAIQAVDLAVTKFTTPSSAQFGQSINVSYAVTNQGTAATTAAWNDDIYLNSVSNSLSGATLLASVPAGTSPLAPGRGLYQHAERHAAIERQFRQWHVLPDRRGEREQCAGGKHLDEQ
jgi:hypothetical protein